MKLSNSLFFGFFFGLGTFVFSQNLKDGNGKRSGKWVFMGIDRPNLGFPKDGKVEEGHFVKGRKEGVWIKYHKDGKTISLKGNYTNNRPEGDYKRYFKNGKLKESGSFAKDQYKGILTRFHSNGKIAYQGTYNNSGMETGTVKYFHENGNIALEYNITNNLLESKVTRYYEDGSIKERFNVSQNGKIENSQKFERKEKPKAAEEEKIQTEAIVYPPKVKNPNTKGLRFVPNGYNTIYNQNDEIWIDGEFKNGQLWDGKVRDYDKDGILNKIRVFKNGVYHSDGQL
jgi:antitoxin component YwqK of YwqJK toxin-antitoxin module